MGVWGTLEVTVERTFAGEERQTQDRAEVWLLVDQKKRLEDVAEESFSLFPMNSRNLTLRDEAGDMLTKVKKGLLKIKGQKRCAKQDMGLQLLMVSPADSSDEARHGDVHPAWEWRFQGVMSRSGVGHWADSTQKMVIKWRDGLGVEGQYQAQGLLGLKA